MSGLIFSGIEKNLALDCLIGGALLFSAAANSAQTLRDPTQPPASQNTVKAVEAVPALSVGTGPPSIIVRDGRSYVVFESHLYAQGQHYGNVHVERISETEVWFRERNVLYRISRFPSSQRSAAEPGMKAEQTLPFSKHTVP